MKPDERLDHNELSRLITDYGKADEETGWKGSEDILMFADELAMHIADNYWPKGKSPGQPKAERDEWPSE